VDSRTIIAVAAHDQSITIVLDLVHPAYTTTIGEPYSASALA
jgi:hypothetical protein